MKKGKYKNIKYLTKPGEDQLKEYEADADLLEDVPRDVRIRKSIALNVASWTMRVEPHRSAWWKQRNRLTVRSSTG